MTDEEAIRALIRTWLDATAAGEFVRLRPLIAEDAVFLSAGQAPLIGREAFAASFEAGRAHHRIAGTVTVEEVVVSGDVGYARSFLVVHVTPVEGGSPLALRGHSLSVFRRHAGGWVMARDANLLSRG